MENNTDTCNVHFGMMECCACIVDPHCTLNCNHVIVLLQLLSFSWKQTPQNIGSSSFSYFLCSSTCGWEGFENELVAGCLLFLVE